jgi:hypothetical protein
MIVLESARAVRRFGSVVDRMNMKLGSKFFNSLRVEFQLISRLQCVIAAR